MWDVITAKALGSGQAGWNLAALREASLFVPMLQFCWQYTNATDAAWLQCHIITTQKQASTVLLQTL